MTNDWLPISVHRGHKVVLVSRLRDHEVYTPTTAFLDVTGVWRVFRSEGGMQKLPFAPTHFMNNPPPPQRAEV